MSKLKEKVIIIVGPTAIGKTRLAVKLARKIKGEIISADSMQVYKHIDIISQKPTKLESSSARHHLVSFLNPSDEYNAGIFSGLAQEKIKNIIKRKKAPIVVGGSGFYVKALIDGIFPSKPKDENLRTKLKEIAEQKGALFLHDMLKRVDPVSAGKIHPNDIKRLIRALEIYETTKKTKTSLKVATKGIKDSYDIKIFGLITDRKKLYQLIDKRVDLMFKKGIVREVKKLLRRKLSITSTHALGIKEIEGYLAKKYDIKRANELLKRNTRRFAKRQLTWFRTDSRIIWLDVDKIGDSKAIDTMVY